MDEGVFILDTHDSNDPFYRTDSNSRDLYLHAGTPLMSEVYACEKNSLLFELVRSTFN